MFTVIHSSAGAGKTHTLVKHYLTLCLTTEESAAYRNVLALTFTNKAAGEMKERVILYLDELASLNVEDGRMMDVMTHLTTKTGLDESAIAERATRCLQHMLHHWSDVAISTIDAFTRKVVQPFARDLQLDHDLQMTTEQSYYLDRAVHELISEAGVDPATTTILSEACLQLLHEERKWDPSKPLSELSQELTKENSINPLKLLGDLRPEQVTALASRLRAQEIVFRQQVRALGNAAMKLIKENGINVEDMAYGKGGIHGYFDKLVAFSDGWETPGVNKLKPIETGKWHSGKADASAITALDSISDPLTRIFNEAENLRETGLRNYTIQRAVGRELMPAFALHALDVKLEAIKREDGVAFFSDLTRKVSEVVKDEPVPFIYERMGERYSHFLIDEFQDTSLLQWQALLPLIDNALSTGGSALLVGDAKQAIYRWRNGEVRLFTQLPKIFGRGDQPLEIEREDTLQRYFNEGERLAFNRRSAGSIVAFNNNLFAPLSVLLAEDLRSVYARHDQETSREEPGLVQIRVLPKDVKGEERSKAFLDFTLKCVQEAIDDGFSPGDIAVLVRGRSLGGPVAHHLVANGHAVVSPDGLKLGGDNSVELLVELLRFLHTGDVAAATRAIQFQAILAALEGVHFATPVVGTTALPNPVKDLRKWLSSHGSPSLKTTLSSLVAQLARANGILPAEDAPVLALIDEVQAFSTQHGQDIGGFLAHWERAGKDRSIAPPANGNAVQVLTVHKSKGLQFPVVIVPNANMTTRGNFGECFWVDPGDAVPDTPIALVRESAALRTAELPELLEEETLRQLDAINLLYVAFTRPEQRLYSLVPEGNADGTTKELLNFIAEHGQEQILEDGIREKPWKTQAAALHRTLRDVADPAHTASLVMRMEAPDMWEPTDPDPYRSYGNAIHELLARIATPDDLEIAFEEALAIGSITYEVAQELKIELSELLSSTELDPWFKKGLTVRNEATIIVSNGRSQRPDRVVFDGDHVRILDIKTGQPSPDHHDQVRSYMGYLRELGHAKVEGALLYVLDRSLQLVES
ncbi:MAG: UvrD-helicase domain-containing protein [Flavobacteriales bacterium]|nr:UvrD-helicase domain-containing protein [Flavobacteriales bacterium]MBK6946355.1 UvrD-helicase domain-containing protein [Flavobacteriales bacterium]MBK9536403.1 UvrD-helicase domain-containing protein [Flavobacteriales bacterium]MBP9137308.1 UvrD-helicase domain-containing protein [Flavobacteriales bacterium]HQV50652.1 UvrD-helicase domain-containing protein [Flavobacteriales bacterium]